MKCTKLVKTIKTFQNIVAFFLLTGPFFFMGEKNVSRHEKNGTVSKKNGPVIKKFLYLVFVSAKLYHTKNIFNC